MRILVPFPKQSMKKQDAVIFLKCVNHPYKITRISVILLRDSLVQILEGLLKQLVKQLEKEKKSLENQLKNYEWRIEQEAKAYHKANDERRTYLTEIAQTNLSIETAKKQKEKWSREKNILKEKYSVPTAERILDLKKGPIKKTVALKQLPKLKH
ncbi:hypothetical protein chiPu_0008383 [Chiloscyllium punctatum]|uniref:Spermatogenesis-associated protein 1 C-terminal domain-containing protein n=1 Tax=Chiloscyllium punctatum TaxID=137246 RepID=A0A401SHQ0_CHIPU|nr:hypothetical protein [Chiloscyllium punctatum]